MTKKTAVNIYCVLKSIIAWAQVQGHLRHDPLRGVRRPKIQHDDRSEARHLEPDEEGRLLSAASTAMERTVVMVLMLAGLRRSELLGLRWPDVEADGMHGALHIQRAAVQAVIGRCKTVGSDRRMDIPQPLVVTGVLP